MKMQITLTPAQELQLQSMVAAGHFQTPEDALAYSIDVLAVELAEPVEYTPEALGRLQQGLEEAERGEFVSQAEVEAFFEDWRNDPAR